ncbi:cobalt ABC transporter permease [Rhodovulum euryhalinum]|uniref:Nickel transport protein n=1 Tax=Rhodovulum euryhalinum TaxID=35805 RepID=A0A4R2KST4_9RHOB|nr:cobalt ABC transporter permease [Rhodovulum euryhalinum]TCO74099.1 nickel transport protein [Rhodovulum euryhalinum]
MTRALVLVLCLALAPLPASAHKVVASVFASGEVIEGEIGFSSGAMAANQPIEVLDGSGNRLGAAMTDADGVFTYRPTVPVRHVFRADLGAGHVAEIEMAADEVAAILAAAGPGGMPLAGPSDTDTAALAAMLRDELRPLRREIAAYKEHHDLQTILGGIGYIAGIFGVGFYVAARRRLAG